MPVVDPTNPYAPPEAELPPRPERHRRWLGSETLGRVAAVVAGFSLVANPDLIHLITLWPAGGRSAARVVGLALVVLAFLPWQVGGRADQHPEQL